MIGWMVRAAMWAAAMGLVLSFSTPAKAGRLDSVRSEVSGGSDGSSSDGSSSSSCCDWDDDDDDDYSGSSVGSGDVVVGPHPPPLRYRRYPYEGGSGDYLFAPRPEDHGGRLLSGQVWGEGAWQGRGLWRSAGGLRLDGRFFGFDGDLSYYLEPAANDALYLGTANINLVPLRLRRGLWRVGGGVNTMIDGRLPGEGSREYALGWNVTTSLDLFPAWPVVVSGRLDLGRLHQAWMGRARGSVGVMLWRIEVYGGYEHTQVGSVGMGGPTVGVRLWL